MRARVTLLRQRGRRLSRRELGPPIVGKLQLTPVSAESNNFGRAVIQLSLIVLQGSVPTPVLVMFDPRLIGVTQSSIALAGIELHAQSNESGGRSISEHQQVWLVTP